MEPNSHNQASCWGGSPLHRLQMRALQKAKGSAGLPYAVIKQDFDWQFYVSYYEDLASASNYEAAYEHWILFGQIEGRFPNAVALEEFFALKKSELPENFDPDHYLQLNPDIKQKFVKSQYRTVKAIQHYLDHGYRENRPYQSDFDWQFYVEYYSDLTNAQSFDEAYEHWLTFGKQEGRCSSEAELNRLIQERKAELPTNFDYQIYLQLNPDLEARFSESLHQEAQAIEHFLRYGASEGRPYLVDAIIREQIALSIRQLRKRRETKLCYRISIKICAPNLREGCQWGDFHYACSLKQAFEQQGHHCRIDCQDTWNSPAALEDDIVIMLRGRHRYAVKEHQINLLWLISHPDRVTDEELNEYDHVFVASHEYTQKLSERLTTPVSCMYQCTNTKLFQPVQASEAPFSDILFVGSSRNTYRPIVRDAIDLGINISIYGPLWEQFIPPSLIKGEYIPNEQLYHYYSNCGILLNDHWDTMRQEGFLSNRLFDASSCGAFVITDAVLGLDRVFSNYIETYNSPKELKEKILYYSQNKAIRLQKAEAARQIVKTNHTFNHRVEQFLSTVKQLKLLYETRYQKLNHIILGNDSISSCGNSLSNSPSAEAAREQAKLLQLSFLHSNVSSLEQGICNYKFQEASIFYRWIWQISRKTHKYQDFVKKFVASEMGLLDSFSVPNPLEKEPPLVSIIMPTFNRAYIIADGIQSVLEQTYKNWNLFVCDDGSTDNTKAVVEQFQDARIHYLQLPKANGSSARNFGLQHSRSEYVAYLDSDNIWHPQHLSICIHRLESKQYSMSCYTGYVDTETIRNSLELKELTCHAFDYYKLLNRNFIDLNSFVHRRCLFDWLGGFDENLPRLQDWDLVLRYTYLFDPLIIQNYTVLYRRNIAWNQVTKLFSKLDVRSIVQNKAFDFIDRQSSILQLAESGELRISLLCSTQNQEDWLKVLAIAESLINVFDVQVVAVSSQAFRRTTQTHAKLKICWIDAPLSSNISVGEILRDRQYQQHLNQIADAIRNTVTVLFSSNPFCLMATWLSRYLLHQPISMSRQHYQSFLRELEELVSLGYSCMLYSNRQQEGFSCNLQNIMDDLKQFPPVLFAEIASEKHKFDSVMVGSTLTDAVSQGLSVKNTDLKAKLGFNSKDFVVAFWEQKSNYRSDALKDFQMKLSGKQCQVVIFRKIDVETQCLTTDIVTETRENIAIVSIQNEQQAIMALKGVDACVFWKAIDHQDEFNLPLAFIYALVCDCIPIMDKTPEYLELDLLNYCKTVAYENWDQLVDCCQILQSDPHKLEKLKRNAQRLYSLKFSPRVVREKIKYLVFESYQRNRQYPLSSHSRQIQPA